MAVREIIKFPNSHLREIATPVKLFDEDLHILAGDLLETMRAAPGIGITAPHVGLLKRVVVLQLFGTGSERTYINPEIIWVSDETITHEEGSVSMPGIVAEVERHAHIRIRYQDLNGMEQVEECDGLSAICHQHEIDQLNGIFWLQRLSKLRRDRLIKRYQKGLR